MLPWQVHIDRIVINYEFPLGEGNSFVIYMGKLKGKAPVMQWINMGEMKQFQDCAVAIRVCINGYIFYLINYFLGTTEVRLRGGTTAS